MGSSAESASNIPLRSPTPPSDSSDDELNELSLDQELAHLDRPHFLDYTQIGIPYPVNPLNENPPPIPPRHPLTNSLPSVNRRSSIPVKMIRSADNVPSDVIPPPVPRGKKHFLDENPIRPDYDYDRSHHSLDREYTRKETNDTNKSQFDGRHHSADRSRQRKIKEPSYTLSRFLENDDGVNHHAFIDNEVRLNDVTLSCSNPVPDRIRANPSVDVYSILSMIGCNNPVEITKKFLDLSKSPNTCATLRHTRCIPLLVQMIHFESDELTKQQAREALRNVVNTDDKVGRREVKVLKYIEQIMDYCELLRKTQENDTFGASIGDSENHPSQAISSLMKISFDEEHRHAMCQLGALQAIANLVHWDHKVHGMNPADTKCVELRRYAGMALTNLTFGDGNNKALLCGNRDFMRALVAQINTDADDLLQVTANVLRNLSWRADNDMKTALNEIGTVSALTKAAMKNRNENTLRAILSALWNLSAHCSKNKAELCLVDGALLFLVEMLTYDAPSKTLSIVENAGGILRNVSSHIAVSEDFRKILRQRNCLGILLQQLKSESLTIVSNVCGTLWNLSARCPEDQQFLWDNGAVPMLRSLVHSKHKMISNGSKMALKNLINFRPGEMNRSTLDPVARSMGLKELPTLSARKQRALEEQLHVDLPNNCDANEVTRTPPALINQKPAKRFTSLETDQQFVERNFGHLSLQCNPNRDQDIKNDFWNANQIQPHSQMRSNSNDIPSTSGTIPKRVMKPVADESKDIKSDPLSAGKHGASAPKKVEVGEGDQITNFSLLYSENPREMRDAKQHKERTFSVAENDTIKCFDNEETPLLSTATSISDLRPISKPTNPHHSHPMQRHLKSGRNTTENSGINTPERPVNYCDEGTPAYFSRRDSFSSLAEEAEFAQDTIHSNKPPLNKVHLNQSNISHSRQESENDGSNSCTVPTTPGDCPSKSVKFNEFNLETPMMFSRHSSLGSLASDEPAMNDDIGSVVSEISRMPSGIISPSEIPDSPSQTMPQSPRRKHTNESTFASDDHPCTSTGPTRRLPLSFEDEVKTFGVENTPALISCATSLSNLSMDDEPKIANDSLVKEMRLMHSLSDEQVNELPDNAIASQQKPDADPVQVDCDAGEALSDSDDSIEDGENDSLLLENCINMGIACGNQVKSLDSGLKSPPALPEPNQILPDDHISSDDENHDNDDDEALLEQCIQAGINTSTAKQIELPPRQNETQMQRMMIFKENPIGMLRKGGNALIDTNIDELNRFSYEDSPCNHSMMSGLSDLTVGSHTARLLKPNRLPSNQQRPGRSNRPQNPCTISKQVSTQENSKSTSVTTLQGSNVASVRSVDVPNVRNGNESCSSVSSNNSNEEELLEKCIQAGMTASIKSQPGMDDMKKENSSSDDELNDDDEALLEQCIQAGITGVNVVGSKSQAKCQPPNLLNKVRNENDSKKVNLNDSTSSIDSVGEEDAALLEQCIQAGINVASRAGRIHVPISKPNQSTISAKINNLSSDDDDLNPEDEALLEQCIQAGISGVGVSIMKPPTKVQDQMKQPKPIMITDPRKSSPVKRSLLPTFKSVTATNHRSRPTNRDYSEEQIKEIDRNMRMRTTLTENRIPNLPLNASDTNSKNAQTTSAVVSMLTTVGATDVVMNIRNGTEICAPDQYQIVDMEGQTMNSKKGSNTTKGDTIDTKVLATPIETGFNQSSLLSTSVLSNKSQNSFMSGENQLLERSNEFPACLGQNESISDSQHSSSIDMEVSNECLFEGLSLSKNGKYKDPNLMMQSVERFTYELVSTAEYLRTANAAQDDDDITITETKGISESKSVSNDTWNEGSNPNGISFPSLSMTAPKIAPIDDDDVTISESSAKSHYEMANSAFIEDSTPTNEQNSGSIRFEIGGQINGLNFSDGKYNPNSLESHDTTSTMTNSTIIAMEAEKIRTLIMNDQNRTDSIISLDKVRPPSVMEKMNSFSYCESLNGPASLKNSPAKCLPHGFMARRALQNNCNNSTHGSSDSINSSCNLDRVKPPSIMDDLLDSMMSVDSIASECVDNPVEHHPIEELSCYETALSECDDMTMTLKNCVDLPFDNTPCGSDFSSAESTPKKCRRSLTPRRKRQMTKERYQTYTIAAGESKEALQSLEIPDGSNASTSRNNAIFQMQISSHTLLINDNDSDVISLVSTDDGEMSSIRAFTRNLPYLDDVSYSNDVTYVNDEANDITYVNDPDDRTYVNDNGPYVNDANGCQDFSINTNTFTKHDRPSLQRNAQMQTKASGSSYGSLSTERDSNSNASSKTVSPNHTITKSPRIIKPTVNGNGPTSIESVDNNEQKGIRGRKKATYVSPYAMPKLTRTAPAPPKPTTKNITPKVEPQRMPPKTETKAKSFIQRSAESLKKMKPAFASKLIRQNSTKKSPNKTADGNTLLDRQKSNGTLIRQSTFIKDEPSEGEIPVIVSEPTSPKKSKTLSSKIPFNRTTSLQASHNVTKSKTNIDIPLQKSASSAFARRTIKAASSASQISSPKISLSPKSSIDSPSTSKSIFKRWSSNSKTISSPQQGGTSKIPAVKIISREPIGSTATRKISGALSFRSAANSANSPSKQNKIVTTNRPISTSGRATNV